MRTFHSSWAYVVVTVNAAVGLWGLFWVRRHLPAPRAFWPAVIAGLGTLVVQIIAGVALISSAGNPPPIHMFYGVVVALAGIFAFAIRSKDARVNVTIFSAAALFIGAVSVRAMITA